MVAISLLRGVNVGGHNKVKMEALCELYESLGLRGARTYVQSGNVVYQTRERDLVKLARRIEDAIEARYGFRPAVMKRSLGELREVSRASPFERRAGLDPAKIAVVFFEAPLDPAVEAEARALARGGEELHLCGREVYIYFPGGMGRSKVSGAALDRRLGAAGTARNWNTVTNLIELGEGIA